MQAIGGQAVFWPATLVDEDGELSGVRSRRDGRRILHPSIQIQNVGRGDGSLSWTARLGFGQEFETHPRQGAPAE